MRNDSARWPSPSADDVNWASDGLDIKALHGLRQTLVSGQDVLSAFAPAIGWPDVAQLDNYTVALRRDRVLLVNGPEFSEGWHSDVARAVTDMSGGYAVFEVRGALVQDLLLRGADMQPSRSALRLWAGLHVILYHHSSDTCVRMHVERAYAEALVETLQRRAEAMLRSM